MLTAAAATAPAIFVELQFITIYKLKLTFVRSLGDKCHLLCVFVCAQQFTHMLS